MLDGVPYFSLVLLIFLLFLLFFKLNNFLLFYIQVCFCYANSTLLLSFSSEFFLSVIVLFNSRIFIWFFCGNILSVYWYSLFDNTLLSYFKNSLILFSFLNIFVTAALMSMSVTANIWATSETVYVDYYFLVYQSCFPVVFRFVLFYFVLHVS